METSKIKPQTGRKSPIDFFFTLGEKATKGDPKRKAKFDYYLLWIMFVAFFSILISNLLSFIDLVNIDLWGSLKYLGWTGVMAAIIWFQYAGLKGARDVKKAIDGMKKEEIPQETEELKVESV